MFFEKIAILNKQSILYGVRTIAPEENYPPVMVMIGFKVGVRKRVGWQSSSGQLP